ncbi:MAG: ABC transporter substrate-binding protein, partial [Dehalococcoidia bacterium]|nr:ABC transporter substrate-binding protein [Dehalococcoidia bacterium]
MADISIKRHWVFLASLSLLLVAALACGGDSGGGAAGRSSGVGSDDAAFRSFSGVSDNATATAEAEAASAAAGADAATAAPAATAEATQAPAAGGDAVVPSGEATIAVNAVNAGVGTPRFCTAGCAEDVYVAGIMETLFRPVYGDTLGAEAEESVLATSFDLDPDLVYLDFTLREGVQFHDGWGEFTAADVVFSFNDANRNTQPESIHGQAGDFAPLIKN